MTGPTLNGNGLRIIGTFIEGVLMRSQWRSRLAAVRRQSVGSSLHWCWWGFSTPDAKEITLLTLLQETAVPGRQPQAIPTPPPAHTRIGVKSDVNRVFLIKIIFMKLLQLQSMEAPTLHLGWYLKNNWDWPFHKTVIKPVVASGSEGWVVQISKE